MPNDKWTIGVGHNLESRGISAVAMAYEDIDTCDGTKHFSHWKDYPDAVQEVLIDLCFNMGITKLMQFKQTIEYINEGLATGNYTKAATELMNSNYATSSYQTELGATTTSCSIQNGCSIGWS